MDRINPHNSDLRNSIFIRDFLRGGAHCFLAFLPICDAKVSKKKEFKEFEELQEFKEGCPRNSE
jgi:hypothetical protein